MKNSIRDTVSPKIEYTDLEIGKEYTINGVLMDKATEKPLLVDGKEVTSSTTFIAQSENGSVNLDDFRGRQTFTWTTKSNNPTESLNSHKKDS